MKDGLRKYREELSKYMKDDADPNDEYADGWNSAILYIIHKLEAAEE